MLGVGASLPKTPDPPWVTLSVARAVHAISVSDDEDFPFQLLPEAFAISERVHLTTPDVLCVRVPIWQARAIRPAQAAVGGGGAHPKRIVAALADAP